jgi:hypothetical protein
MRAIRLFLLTVSFATSVFAEATGDDLRVAQKLAADGRYEEALQKHIWFHEESKTSGGMAGVRLSYALDDWVSLAQKYPKALIALREIRDQDEKVLLSGSGGFEQFADFAAINAHINEAAKSYDLFKILDVRYPEAAAQCYHVAKDLLVAKGEYRLCRKYQKDPISAFELLRYNRETLLGIVRQKPGEHSDMMLRYSDESFLRGTRQLIEILVGLNQDAEAEEIQKRALAYFDNEQIRLAISDAKRNIESKRAK